MDRTMSKHTPEPWAVPVANVFRVIAPHAPHNNKKSGMCPPYEWAIACDVDPESTNGPEAAANARRIVACVNALAGLTTEEIESGILKQVIEKVAEALDKFKAKHNIKMGEP